MSEDGKTTALLQSSSNTSPRETTNSISNWGLPISRSSLTETRLGRRASSADVRGDRTTKVQASFTNALLQELVKSYERQERDRKKEDLENYFRCKAQEKPVDIKDHGIPDAEMLLYEELQEIQERLWKKEESYMQLQQDWHRQSEKNKEIRRRNIELEVALGTCRAAMEEAEKNYESAKKALEAKSDEDDDDDLERLVVTLNKKVNDLESQRFEDADRARKRLESKEEEWRKELKFVVSQRAMLAKDEEEARKEAEEVREEMERTKSLMLRVLESAGEEEEGEDEWGETRRESENILKRVASIKEKLREAEEKRIETEEKSRKEQRRRSREIWRVLKREDEESENEDEEEILRRIQDLRENLGESERRGIDFVEKIEEAERRRRSELWSLLRRETEDEEESKGIDDERIFERVAAMKKSLIESERSRAAIVERMSGEAAEQRAKDMERAKEIHERELKASKERLEAIEEEKQKLVEEIQDLKRERVLLQEESKRQLNILEVSIGKLQTAHEDEKRMLRNEIEKSSKGTCEELRVKIELLKEKNGKERKEFLKTIQEMEERNNEETARLKSDFELTLKERLEENDLEWEEEIRKRLLAEMKGKSAKRAQRNEKLVNLVAKMKESSLRLENELCQLEKEKEETSATMSALRRELRVKEDELEFSSEEREHLEKQVAFLKEVNEKNEEGASELLENNEQLIKEMGLLMQEIHLLREERKEENKRGTSIEARLRALTKEQKAFRAENEALRAREEIVHRDADDARFLVVEDVVRKLLDKVDILEGLQKGCSERLPWLQQSHPQQQHQGRGLETARKYQNAVKVLKEQLQAERDFSRRLEEHLKHLLSDGHGGEVLSLAHLGLTRLSDRNLKSRVMNSFLVEDLEEEVVAQRQLFRQQGDLEVSTEELMRENNALVQRIAELQQEKWDLEHHFATVSSVASESPKFSSTPCASPMRKEGEGKCEREDNNNNSKNGGYFPHQIFSAKATPSIPTWSSLWRHLRTKRENWREMDKNVIFNYDFYSDTTEEVEEIPELTETEMEEVIGITPMKLY